MMRISVVGTGYVGLVSGVCLADRGHQVTCVDKDVDKVQKISNGIAPIYEKGLDDLLSRTLGKTLRATTDLRSAVHESELSLIAVGTPFDGTEIDTGYVEQAATEIGQALKDKDGYHVVVVKSTVVPGTTDELVLTALEKASGKKAGADFGVGMNPEFLREGEAVGDFMNPDRIVLGGLDERTHRTLQEVYEPFTGVDVVLTNNKTAEMIKYASNSLLATLISFSNEIGNLCSSIGGMDALEVMRGVHLDKRFTPILPSGERITPGFISYLEAGCGFGGSCFPKDVKALIAHGRKHASSMRILESVIETNLNQPNEVLTRVEKHFPSVENVDIAVLGLAFKPGTDDMRESPAIPIVNALREKGARIKAYDPVATPEARKIFGDDRIEYCDDLAETIADAQVIVLLTRWDEFKGIPELLEQGAPSAVLVDGRRMINKDSVARYEGIGIQL
jgi:UDPglucose 6-dehydrogenase/GDP-mannose 6-dehydrogenase